MNESRCHRTRFRRVSKGVLLLGGGVLVCAGLVFYWAFCNVPRHPARWTTARIDLAIDRGLEFLCDSEAFAKRYEEGGEHIIHHFILDLILAKEPHQRLREQQMWADRISQDIPEWRTFLGLPGRPASATNAATREEIQALIREDTNPYGRWLLWSVHASWAALEPMDHRALFEDTAELRGGNDLTHAFMAYWIMNTTALEAAERLGARERLDEIVPRINRFTAWAPRCSDGYLERVSFVLLLDPSPKIPRRWIERILNTQNEDRGWSMIPPYYRTAQEILGLPITSHSSQPHPTFLALLALTRYREQLRAEEADPANPLRD